MILYPTDAYYGHNYVLAWYTGASPDRPWCAQLQHGWNLSSGFGATKMLPGLPKLMWNRKNAEFLRSRLSARDARRVHVVGAPFAYLDHMLVGKVARQRPPDGTLLYPFHGASSEYGGDHRVLAGQVRERETGPVTVCLYWRDHAELKVRDRYSAAGFRVICHGRRTDPLFLVRQWLAILAHRRVVTNRVSTALWYAGWLGREIEVYGPVWGNQGSRELERAEKLQQQRWPALFSGPVVGDAARTLAHVELGASDLRSADALRRFLGWSGPRRPMASLLATALLVRRLVTKGSSAG